AGKACFLLSFNRSSATPAVDPGVARERAGAAGRNVSRLSFHSLRHSFTSQLANAGVPPEVRQQLTGHSDLSSHRIYTYLEVDTLGKAIAALPALLWPTGRLRTG